MIISFRLKVAFIKSLCLSQFTFFAVPKSLPNEAVTAGLISPRSLAKALVKPSVSTNPVAKMIFFIVFLFRICLFCFLVLYDADPIEMLHLFFYLFVKAKLRCVLSFLFSVKTTIRFKGSQGPLGGQKIFFGERR